MGKLAYEVKIPENWKVHPVFSIFHLEPAPAPGSDPYHRTLPEPEPIFMAGDTDRVKSYEIECIIRKKRRYNKIHYLIRWKGYGAVHDVWRSEQKLGNAQELIQEFESREMPIRNDRATGERVATTPKRGRERPKRRQE